MNVNDASLIPATNSGMVNLPSNDITDTETFMTLLLEQLKHQDPLDPLKNEEMIQQLATLSNLEEMKAVNENLEILQVYSSALNNEQSVSLIGKYVKAVGTKLSIDEVGDRAPINFHLSDDAAKVNITVTNEEGHTVKVIEDTDLAKGDNTIVWDGTDLEGNPVEPGKYDFQITATDENDKPVAATTFLEGYVTSIKFDNGVPVLIIDDQEISLGDIYQIHTTKPEEGNNA